MSWVPTWRQTAVSTTAAFLGLKILNLTAEVTFNRDSLCLAVNVLPLLSSKHKTTPSVKSVLYAELCFIVLLHHQQEEMLPSGAQTAPESDSDSGMGSPAEEPLTETTANNKEEQQGDLQSL